MGLDKDTIDEIVWRILAVSKPERVILFGSAATGNMGPDSDIDLLVVKPSPIDTRKESVLIHDALRGLGYAFEVLYEAA